MSNTFAEKPIIFSGPMVRAILNETKIQTRRVMKPQPVYDPELYKKVHTYGSQHGGWVWQVKPDHLWFCWDDWKGFDPRIYQSGPYQPGDRLWVRETWATNYDLDHVKPSNLEAVHYLTPIYYKADGPNLHNGYELGFLAKTWRPSIFMPRWASRLTLEIAEVRVERLQDISEKDALAEGVDLSIPGGIHQQLGPKWAVPRFQALWDSINGKRPGCSWQDNPRVWVIEFSKLN